MSGTLPKLFHLKRGTALLAVLEACQPSEMFWLICNFKPTALFAEVEPLYRRAGESEDIDEINQIDEQLLAMGLVLLDVENNVEIRYFVLLVEGDQVELRYAEQEDDS